MSATRCFKLVLHTASSVRRLGCGCLAGASLYLSALHVDFRSRQRCDSIGVVRVRSLDVFAHSIGPVLDAKNPDCICPSAFVWIGCDGANTAVRANTKFSGPKKSRWPPWPDGQGHGRGRLRHPIRDRAHPAQINAIDDSCVRKSRRDEGGAIGSRKCCRENKRSQRCRKGTPPERQGILHS